jgi:hypothetical protein
MSFDIALQFLIIAYAALGIIAGATGLILAVMLFVKIRRRLR